LSLRPWPGRRGCRASGPGAPGRPTGAHTACAICWPAMTSAPTGWGPPGRAQGRPDHAGGAQVHPCPLPRPGRDLVVLDNLSAHFTPQIRAWAGANRVRLVPTPTYASYLNRIECHFWAFVEFVIRGSDYASHDELTQATRGICSIATVLIAIPASESSKTGARLPDTPLAVLVGDAHHAPPDRRDHNRPRQHVRLPQVPSDLRGTGA
jgi:hypothetical protein